MLCDPEDEVLVPAPGSPFLEPLACIRDVQLCSYPLHFEGGCWRLDPALVFDAISERTRAIVVGNPHEPTGACLDAEGAEAIDALGVPIISDETFAHCFPDGRGVSILSAQRESLCFALGVHDASLARIGVGGPGEVVAQAKERLERLSLMFPAVSAPPRQSWTSRCGSNWARLHELTRDAAIDVPIHCGGTWACLRIRGDRTDQELALSLLENEGVLVHPGRVFDFPSRPAWLVVSLLTPEVAFDVGIRAIVRLQALSAH